MKYACTRALAAIILLFVWGCSGQGGPAQPFPDPPVSEEPGQEAGPGWLAYIGGDGNVYVTTVDRSGSLAITDDATTSLEGEGRSYHRLSWSPQGKLAFAAVERSGMQARSQLYSVSIPEGEPELLLQNEDNFLIYLYWSPVGCPDQEGCQRLAYLVNEGGDIGLHLLEAGQAGLEDRLAAVGRPVYFSWSPEGDSLLLHTGGYLPNDSQAMVSLYDIEGDYLQDLPLEVGDFQSPSWLPSGRRWIGVSRENGSDALRIFGDSSPDELTSDPPAVVESDDEIVFTLSPGGERIAYAVRGRGRVPYYGPVHVTNLESGESRQVTPDGLPTLGFFWSPEGQRLGYLTRLILDENLWMQWRVADVVEDRDSGYQVFRPSPAMEFIIQSFTQYAHSHRFWSPQGRYLVYAERDAGGDAGLLDRVWLIDTWAGNDQEPLLVDEGSFAVWSWR